MKAPFVKQTLLLTALLACSQVSAIELFKDDKTSVALRGYISGVYVDSDGSDEINEGLSRWGIDINRQLKHGWNAGVTLEWGLSFDRNNEYTYGGDGFTPQGSSDDAMFTRLGYVHFEHDKWGDIGIGKQWSVFYDVTSGTDILNLWGASASGSFNLNTDGGLSGTGRVEQAITWRKSYNNFDFGLQFQAQDEAVLSDSEDPALDGTQIATVGNGYGVSIIYNIDKFKLGVAYNVSDIDVIPELAADSDDDEITAFSMTYGTNNAEGFYVSAMYGLSKNHEIDNNNFFIDAKHSEFVVKYTTSYYASFYTGFNRIETDDDNYEGDYELYYNFIGAEYNVLEGVAKLFFEARKDDSTNHDLESNRGLKYDDTQFALGATIYL